MCKMKHRVSEIIHKRTKIIPKKTKIIHKRTKIWEFFTLNFHSAWGWKGE